MLISPLCTICTREFGRPYVMSAGVLLMAAGFIAASFATQIWHLYLTQGVMVGLGIGSIFIPAIAVLPQWFLKRRSLAQGLASCGSGFGGLAFSLGTGAMIQQLSLAWSLRITGILCMIGNGISTILVRDRNHLVKPPQLGFAVHLLKRYDCLLLLSWAFTNLLGYMIILYSLSAYAYQVVGLSQSQASILTAVLNLGTGIGRPCIGLASDKFGRIETAACLTLFNGIIVFAIWLPATNFGVLLFFAIISGATLGTYWMVCHAVLVRVAPADSTISDRRAALCRSSRVKRAAIVSFLAMAHDSTAMHFRRGKAILPCVKNTSLIETGNRPLPSPAAAGKMGLLVSASIRRSSISRCFYFLVRAMADPEEAETLIGAHDDAAVMCRRRRYLSLNTSRFRQINFRWPQSMLQTEPQQSIQRILSLSRLGLSAGFQSLFDLGTRLQCRSARQLCSASRHLGRCLRHRIGMNQSRRSV